MKTIGEDKSVTSEYILTSLESLMEKQEASLRQLNEYNVILTNQYNQKVEQKFVLEKASPFFNNEAVLSAVNDIPTAPVDASSVLEKGADNIRFGYITGVLKQENQPQFERMLFRATRGNCLVRFADVETPLANAETGVDERLAVFIVFWMLGRIVWLAFVAALPTSLITLLVLNSLWEKGRRNEWIVGALVLSLLATVYFCFARYRPWQIFLLAAPAELIVWLAFRVRRKPQTP